MRHLPVFLDVKAKPCAVVGGGEVAARKIVLLLKAGAWVTVVAPGLCDEVRELADLRRISHVPSPFMPEFLRGVSLVIAATNDRKVNHQVSETAVAMGIPVNVVDAPELCTFVMPAIIDRSPLMVAISSGGASPVLARLLRSRLEALIPAGLGRLAALAGEFRDDVKRRFARTQARRSFWESVFEGPIAALALSGQERRARKALSQAMEKGDVSAFERGSVYLIGAGPGNPELLTLRALRLLQQADVIVYDNLIGDGILDLARRDAERIYVGKRCSRHSMPQDEINRLLVRLATAGKRVARLKGGDPFFFGRGGEELQALAGSGIAYEVVPGITAANGVASYAGIPLTHRDYAQSCIFATGHLKDGTVNLDWEALARPHQTAVIYMGLGGLPVICRKLVCHGLPAATPVAAIQSATTHDQRVVSGTLETLPDLVACVGLTSPVLLVVGEVVKLHRQLAWFAPELPEPDFAATDARQPIVHALDPVMLTLMQRHNT